MSTTDFFFQFSYLESMEVMNLNDGPLPSLSILCNMRKSKMAAITYIEEICVYSFEFFEVKDVHLYISEVGEFENYRKN